MLPHQPFSFSFFGFFFGFLFWTVFFFFFVCEKERKKEKERERERFNKKEKKTKKKQRKRIVWSKLIEKIQMQTKNKIKEKKKKKNWICIGPILMEAWTTKKKQEHLNSFSLCQISRKKIAPKIKIGFSAKKFFFFVFCFYLIFVFGFCFLKDEKNRLLEIKRFLVFSMYHFYIKKEKRKTNLFFSKWER